MSRTVLVIGIIILLFGMSVVSSTNISEVNHIYSDNQLWETDSKEDNDTTPPVTNVSLNGTLSEHGIYSTHVEVTLNATDDLSGVNITYYMINGGKNEIYIEPFLVGDGMYNIFYWSIDNAGNAEDYKVVDFEIDLVPPYITLHYEKIKYNKFEFNPFTDDYGSGAYKVEYYIDDEYMHTSYWEDSHSFIWIWTPPEWGRFYLVKSVVYDRAENTDYDLIRVDFPRNIIDINLWYQNLFERFPLLEVFLRILNL